MSQNQSAEQDRLSAIVRRFPQHKILVVGDLVADQFLYGGIGRVSREAPVLILRYEKTETTPGGAANCAANIAALDAEAALAGVIGDDEAGAALTENLLKAGVNIDGVVKLPGYKTTTKVRILAGQVHSTRQQVLRIDYEGQPLPVNGLRDAISAKVAEQARTASAIIISDYNYGVVDESLASLIRNIGRERQIPVVVDSRHRLAEFRDFTSATPNEEEIEGVAGHELASRKTLSDEGDELRARLGFKALLVTLGSHGMMLFEEGEPPLEIPAVGSKEPVDVTGAGDTVIAAYTLALASGASFADAARLANHGGSNVVMKRGTASAGRQELLSSVLRWGELR